MKNDALFKSNCIQILKTFSKSEMREFERFVRSPFHNNRNEVIKFFNELKKYYPFNNSGDLTKERLYSTLYPGNKFSDGALRIMSSYLKKIIEEYLCYKKFSSNRFEKSFMLISSLRERRLDKNTEQEIKAAKTKLQTEKIDTNYFLINYRLSLFIDEHNLLKGNRKMLTENSKDFTDSLICYFMGNLFAELSARKVNEEDYNTVFEPGLLEPFIKLFDTGSFFKNILNYPGAPGIFLNAYYYSYLADQNYSDEAVQQKLKDLLFEHSDKFTREMAYNLYVMLMNINIYGANAGKHQTRYYKKAFMIFKDMEEKNLLTGYESEFMQEEIFLNILLTANSLREFDWAEEFVEKHISKLHHDIRNNWYNYSKASINFNKKQFDDALKFIMNVNFEKALQNVAAKRLLAMIYYELNYTEQLLSFIDSHSHYLNNTKGIPQKLKSSNLLFLKNLNTLAKINYNNDLFGLQKLKKKLKHNGGRKNWLLEKIEELEKTLK